MTRLFKDIQADIEKLKGDPIAFIDAMNSAIDKQEVGARRVKQLAVALCVGAAREVGGDFERFEELRNNECLRANKRVQAATEDNFRELVPYCVATRTFYKTDATENRTRVYGYVVDYFMDRKIPLERIPEKIKAMKGIDGVYAHMKAKKHEAEEPESEVASTGSSNTNSRASGTDEPAETEWAGASGEPDLATDETSKASGERLTVKAILENYLLVKMPKKELERYRDGSARRGQRRQLDAVYGGKDTNNLHVWDYVYGRDVDADLSSLEDNDNNVDHEDEDAA